MALERRSNEYEHVSLRALALRMLKRIDPEIAATFVEFPAFEEYSHAVEHWIASDRCVRFVWFVPLAP